jgi:hypothetical protein
MTHSAGQDHKGFRLPISKVRGSVFLPRYYDPEIGARAHELQRTHNLVLFGELVDDGGIVVSTGNEIGKMAYGTGNIPFVRTSDISNWEIKTDTKQGVSKAIYDEYAGAQNVKAGDILFVRDGTYLIGQVACVTPSDLPMLYQSHLLKFRITKRSLVNAPLLMAALSTVFVRRQIRAKKFTADIIDTIGDRFRELQLPIPKDKRITTHVTREVRALIEERARLRDVIRVIPHLVQGNIRSFTDRVPDEIVGEINEGGNTGFLQSVADIKGQIFIPKYYDPTLARSIDALGSTHELVPISSLISDGVLSAETGIEVGKMAYGTGEIPFVRTSDISNWELKGDPKQSVSEQIYQHHRQDVRANDIFVVRDGTYLVGTSCIVGESDIKMLYCGGLYKLRAEKSDMLDPYLLLTILNAPIVRRQMRAKQFTRDIIDTLGHRLFEVVLPIPKNPELRSKIAKEARSVIQRRAALRDRTKKIAWELEGVESRTNVTDESFLD